MNIDISSDGQHAYISMLTDDSGEYAMKSNGSVASMPVLEAGQIVDDIFRQVYNIEFGFDFDVNVNDSIVYSGQKPSYSVGNS